MDKQTLKQLPENELTALCAQAQAEISRHKVEVERLDVEAATKAQAFELTPGEDTFMDREVSAQRARNARKALEALEAEHAPTFSELSRRKQIRRRDELRELHEGFGDELRASAGRLADIILRASDELELEFAGLMRRASEIADAADEATHLERGFGDGRRYSKPSLSGIVTVLCAELERTVGKPNGLTDRAARLAFSAMTSTKSVAELSLWFPSSVKSGLL